MNSSILRLLDANANRAREALRVLEDYARFVLDDSELSAALKSVRHDLASATAPFLADAILHRDTPNDAGTGNKTAAEFARQGVSDVVVAADKRLGEALRALEEYAKIASPGGAARIETLRYRFYDIELRIVRTLRWPGRFAGVRLYVLITQSICRRGWLETAERAIMGGADCIQLREKDLPAGELLDRARQCVELCRKHNVICIINDRPDIAMLAGADGVHVGQEDLPAIEARKIIGPEKILGVSTHCMEQARQAVRDGADYIGVGPVFPSRTKTREILPGIAYAREVAGAIRIPAVAIAGITRENVDEVTAAGMKAIAVTAAVAGAEDAKLAAEELKARLMAVERNEADANR